MCVCTSDDKEEEVEKICFSSAANSVCKRTKMSGKLNIKIIFWEICCDLQHGIGKGKVVG